MEIQPAARRSGGLVDRADPGVLLSLAVSRSPACGLAAPCPPQPTDPARGASQHILLQPHYPSFIHSHLQNHLSTPFSSDGVGSSSLREAFRVDSGLGSLQDRQEGNISNSAHGFLSPYASISLDSCSWLLGSLSVPVKDRVHWF